MSQLRVLRACDYPRMPWKNGGGFTAEITRDAGEGLDGFGWRLSIADIESRVGFLRSPVINASSACCRAMACACRSMVT